MPANQYRGARIAFVTEHEVKQELSVMAKQENRTLSYSKSGSDILVTCGNKSDNQC